jgi:Tol biopolymer transport system component
MTRFTRAVLLATVSSTLLLVAAPAGATYPGQNGRIAISMDLGSGSEIYTLRANGKDVTPLTDVNGDASEPDWSPDGTKIVFERTLSDGHCRIEMIKADGTGLVDLTRPGFKDGCHEYTPSFTPNGRRIVYTAQACNHCPLRIWSMNLRGQDQRMIFRWGGAFVDHPNVSPDGKTIEFTEENETSGQEKNAIYTVRMNGTHLTQVVPFRVDPCGCGEWAPNGKRIGDSSHVNRAVRQPPNLFTVRPDGRGLRYLTRYRAKSPDISTAAGAYSPNGRWILFKHIDDSKGRYVLLKIHPNGRGLTRIRNFDVNFYGRDWGPRPA